MFNEEDLKNYSALGAVIGEAYFKLEGKAVGKTASLLYWYNQLGKKIQASIELNKPIEDEEKVIDDV